MTYLQSITNSAPKVIIGEKGKYFRVAAGDEAEIYLKFNFENGQWVTDTMKDCTIQFLRANVVYFGEQFEVPEPFKVLEVRKYRVEGVLTPGVLLGKVVIPLGQFNNSLAELYATSKPLMPDIEQALAPLFEAAKVTKLFSLDYLWDILMEEVQADPLPVARTVMVNDQRQETLTALMKAQASQMKATADTPPEEPPQEDGPAS